jgi:putative transposase
MRFRIIEDRRDDYPVRQMCAILGVSPAGYYAWCARPESRRAVANRGLLREIVRVHRDSGGRYGSPLSMPSCGLRVAASAEAGSSG